MKGIMLIALPVEASDDKPLTNQLLQDALNTVTEHAGRREGMTTQVVAKRFIEEGESMGDALKDPQIITANDHGWLKKLGFTPEDLGLVVAMEDGKPVYV